MSLSKILICLDTDSQPSTFDSVVAVDADVEHLFRHGGVRPADVQSLVHGAMFTRGPQDLKNTALFIGGSDVEAADELLAEAKECFFGPMRVSVLLDPSGANTTAAAAVLSAANHMSLKGTEATVLAATGPVGRRVVRLLARAGASVRVASRKLERAQDVCKSIQKAVGDAQLAACQTATETDLGDAVDRAELVIASGAPAVELLSDELRKRSANLKVAIDLSAVPPLGIGGLEMQDKAQERDRQLCYGALGVGGLKMKIHKAAIRQLFTSNDLVLDAEEIYELGTRV